MGNIGVKINMILNFVIKSYNLASQGRGHEKQNWLKGQLLLIMVT